MKRWLMLLAIMVLAVPLTVGLPGVAASEAPPSISILYGHDNIDSMIMAIDTATGLGTKVGLTGFQLVPVPSGMATSAAPVPGPDGVLYEPGTVFALLWDRVVTVDTTTGAVTIVVQTDPGVIGGRGIAFGPNGATLYLMDDTGVLSTIDTVTGNVVPVANTGYPAVSLELDPDTGTFYAISGTTLVNIDPSGNVINALEGTISACTLVRSEMGVWYTVDGGQLYTVDISTGTASVVEGSGGLGLICGTAFTSRPPVVRIVEGVNPSGKNVPPAGSSTLPGPKGGINDDGFYQLFAQDDHDPNPYMIICYWDPEAPNLDGSTGRWVAVRDKAGNVFVCYSGTVIKLTQAPGATPIAKKMGSSKGKAGAVDYHITIPGHSEALVVAYDASGKSSWALGWVPPLPK